MRRSRFSAARGRFKAARGRFNAAQGRFLSRWASFFESMGEFSAPTWARPPPLEPALPPMPRPLRRMCVLHLGKCLPPAPGVIR